MDLHQGAAAFGRSLLSLVFTLETVNALSSNFRTEGRLAAIEVGRLLDGRHGINDVVRLQRISQHSGPLEPKIAYEIPGAFAIYKPPGWEVDQQPISSSSTRRLSLHIQSLLPESSYPILYDAGHSFGLLHRLDTNGSGLILVAKTFQAYYELRMQLSTMEIQRDYVSLLHGRVPLDLHEIDAPLLHSPVETAGGAPTTTCAERGKPALTFVKVLAHCSLDRPDAERQCLSLVALRIRTGRRHQIRAHAAHIGHPVVSDAKYGAATAKADSEWCERNFLHRYRLAFKVEGDTHEVVQPLPPDLVSALACLVPNCEQSSASLRSWCEGDAMCDWARLDALPNSVQ